MSKKFCISSCPPGVPTGPLPAAARSVRLWPVIDHVCLLVGDVPPAGRSTAILAPLGLRAVYADHAAVEVAEGRGAPCWIPPAAGDERRRLHLAFTAADRDAVPAFHAAAIGVGAEVLRARCLFPASHDGYVACFVRDPDGHDVEAVCRQAATQGGPSPGGPTHDGAPHEDRPVRGGARGAARSQGTACTPGTACLPGTARCARTVP